MNVRMCLQTLRPHTDEMIAIAFSKGVKMLASTSYDSVVRLWDPHFTVPTGALGGIRFE